MEHVHLHGAETRPTRPRQFRTRFGVQGPFLPTGRRGWARVAHAAAWVAAASFIFGAIGRAKGLF